MPHAKSLRAIGQSLESLGVIAFVMHKNGRSYVVRSADLRKISETAIKASTPTVLEVSSPSSMRARSFQEDGSVRYDPSYVSWLDAQGRRRRRRRFSAQSTGTARLSQLLRTLGKHLDQLEPHSFNICWSQDGVCLDYESGDGQRYQEIFTLEKLRDLTVRSRFRRARRR